MSLRNELSAAAQDIFDALGDVKEQVVYVKKSLGTYNATTGKTPEYVKRYPIEVVFSDVTDTQDVLADMQLGDLKCYMLGSDVPFEPQINDVIEKEKTTYTITSTMPDPIQAVWTLIMRKKDSTQRK